nr:D-alanyl-D-alanine carboxypeptidase family protein [Thermoclostridium sp.]
MKYKKSVLRFTIIISVFMLLGGCNKPEALTGNPAEEIQSTTPAIVSREQQEIRDVPVTDTLVEPPGVQVDSNIPCTGIPGQDEPAIGDKPIQQVKGLVRLEDIDPDIAIELKYATTDNFTKQKVYPLDICVLQKQTAGKLAKVNAELMQSGYRIKVWDAYRPLAVQRIFWELVPDSKFVANPDKGGSKHNRGTAVDVTLIDMEGNELEMPSGFDDFSGKGSRKSTDMSELAKKNMKLLTDAMVRNGFTTITSEWWHYNDSDSDKFEAIDVDLEEFLQGDAPVNDHGLVIDPYAGKLNRIPGLGDSKQVLLVIADGTDTIKAEARAYEKVNESWQPSFEPMPAVLGSKGLSYSKKEGDKKSPIGVYALKRSFGRVENPGTKLTYTQFYQNDFWVDDIQSELYNTFQEGPANGRWSSAEDLFAIGNRYKYFVVVEYNTVNPLP